MVSAEQNTTVVKISENSSCGMRYCDCRWDTVGGIYFPVNDKEKNLAKLTKRMPSHDTDDFHFCSCILHSLLMRRMDRVGSMVYKLKRMKMVEYGLCRWISFHQNRLEVTVQLLLVYWGYMNRWIKLKGQCWKWLNVNHLWQVCGG